MVGQIFQGSLRSSSIFASQASPSALTSASSFSRVGCFLSRVRAVTLLMPGVTLTLTVRAVRLASSFLPAPAWVAEQGPMKLEPGLFDGGNKLLVLGHEAVTGKDRVVAVVLGDLDDLVDPLDPLFLAGAGVVGDAVDAAGIGQLAQFGSQGIRIDDGVLFGEKDAEVGDPHLGVDIHRLFADRAAADDERLEILAGKGTHPLGGGLAQAAIPVDQGFR